MSGIRQTSRGNDVSPTIRLNNGMELPVVGIGTYSLHGDTCINAVAIAIQHGYRLIDTASFYRNEVEVGQGVRQAGIPREEIFVQTKLYPDQYGNADKAIDEALTRLGLGYIDMLLLHHPATNDVEAYCAIERAIQAGKVRSAGISCYYIQELGDFLGKVSVRPALVQNEIHPFYQDDLVVEHIQQQGLIVQSWYPLGGRGYTGALLNNAILRRIATAHQKSVAQIILRWDLQRGITVIPGSSNPEHIRENISLFNFSLTDEEMESIATLNKNEKHDWY